MSAKDFLQKKIDYIKKLLHPISAAVKIERHTPPKDGFEYFHTSIPSTPPTLARCNSLKREKGVMFVERTIPMAVEGMAITEDVQVITVAIDVAQAKTNPFNMDMTQARMYVAFAIFYLVLCYLFVMHFVMPIYSS